MASGYHGRSAAYTPELIDLSDSEELLSEDIISISEEEPTQRELNDHRLTQSIDYLAEERGDDSPATFIDRVDRIDEALLQQLPQQGRDFDTELYRRARTMVREVQHEFEEAAQQSSSSIPATEESEEELPQYYTPSAAQALYRARESTLNPAVVEEEEGLKRMPKASEPKPSSKAKKEETEVIHRERKFKYGGPGNMDEVWHKDFPAALPFPETIQMAHWESVKIDYDLSESGKKAKADGKVVETNIPFKYIARHYENLPLYDSGSRFKLPALSKEDQAIIEELGTVKELKEVVAKFNHGDRKAELKKDYAPRMWLQGLSVNTQLSPNANEIRRAVNATPSKPRTPVINPAAQTPATGSKAGGTSIETSSNIRDLFTKITSGPRPQTPNTPQGKTPTKTTPGIAEPDTNVYATLLQLYKDGHCKKEDVAAAQTPGQKSALVRRIQKAVQEAEENSARRQSGVSTEPPTPTRTAPPEKVQVQIQIPQKRGPGRPKKHELQEQAVPVPQSSRKTRSTAPKRKRSIGQQGYAPEGPSPKKRVSFVPVQDDTVDISDDPKTPPPQPKKTKTTPAKKLTPAKPVAKKLGIKANKKNAVPLYKSTSKAAAGAQVRRKNVYEQSVPQEEYERIMAERRAEGQGTPVQLGSTRGGGRFRKATG